MEEKTEAEKLADAIEVIESFAEASFKNKET